MKLHPKHKLLLRFIILKFTDNNSQQDNESNIVVQSRINLLPS